MLLTSNLWDMYSCAIIIRTRAPAPNRCLSELYSRRKEKETRVNVVVSSYARKEIHNKQHGDIKDIPLH